MSANSQCRFIACILIVPITLTAETSTWTDGAAGQLTISCSSGGSYYASNNHNWNRGQVSVVNPCGHEGTYISNLSNWDTPAYPNSTGVDVVIHTGSPVELGVEVAVSTLDLNADGQLNINGYAALNVHGGSIQNDGLINLADVGDGVATLKIHADTTLDGSGTITFATDDDCWIESQTADDVLTVGTSQTLLATSFAVAGTSASKISAALTNTGTITADGGGLRLDTHPKTNNSLIQAINGGNIYVSGITIDNTAGTITAAAGSTIKLTSSTVTGGLLNGPGVIDVLSGDATFNTGVTIAPEATIAVDGYDVLNISGTITNDGLIQLDDVGDGVAGLNIIGDATLDGSGRVLLVSDDDNWITSTTDTDVLTIGANQEIITSADTLAGSSASRVTAAISNKGTITADGGGLRFDTNPKTNHSTIQSINGGLLQFSGITVDNATGILSVDAGSTISLYNTTVQGGLITGAGTISASGTTTTFQAGGLTIDSGIRVDIGGDDIVHLVGDVTNHGNIVLTDIGYGDTILRIDGNVTLSGNGNVVFNSDDDNVIDSANPTDVLTIAPSQTLLAVPSAVASSSGSRIETLLVNEGTITANEGGLYFGTNDKTNHSLIQTTNGGAIRVGPITVFNSGGSMTTDAAGTLTLDGATISGGLLDGSGTVNVLTSDATLDGGVTVGSGVTVQLGTDDILHLASSITNNGNILIADTSVGSSKLQISGSVTLTGSGRVVMNSSEDNLIDSADPAYVLTIGPDQEITTSIDSDRLYSIINSAIVNEGTITAATGGLRLSTHNKTNQNIIRTTGGGILRLTGITLDNSAGRIHLDSAGTFQLDNGTISGGLIDGTGTVDVLTSDGALNNGLNIGPDVAVAIGTGDILTLSDTITNDGTIFITDTSSGQATLRIAGSVTLAGSGQVVFNQTEDNILDSVDPADVLTVGASQRITTSANSRVSWSVFHAATVNNGLIEGNGGGLSLRTNPKTNQGIFRAVNGGELEVRTADTILTNYHSGTLSGGRWEVLATDAVTTMDLQGAVITTLAPGTEVVMSGALASFPALQLETVEGTLTVESGKVLDIGEKDFAASGTLEFGLTGVLNATRIDVDGNVNLSGCTINFTDRGLVPGTYQILNWTGTLTGSPVIGSMPPGYQGVITVGANSLELTVTELPYETPVILDTAYDAASNTVTLTYQSIDGIVFGVRGSDDLENLLPLSNTAVGTGAVMQYTHHPQGGGNPAGRFFFQMFNPATE